jgi:glycosyltransferase involved in cell wall biosynthesis
MCEWTSSRCPTGTIVVSRTLRQHYASMHGRVPQLIPNAVAPCVRRPPERIARHGLVTDGFLLFAGRLSPEKGVHTLLEALRPLQSRMPLVLAGGSSYSDEYIDSLRRAAGDGVIFLGNVDRETMDELYSNCYAFVLPSVMEGLSVALLEALSAGVCILTTNIAENLEAVGDAALTFPPGAVEALRACLRRVLDDPALMRTYRRRALEQAGTQFDWDDVARETEHFYYQLLGSVRQTIKVPVVVGGGK